MSKITHYALRLCTLSDDCSKLLTTGLARLIKKYLHCIYMKTYSKTNISTVNILIRSCSKKHLYCIYVINIQSDVRTVRSTNECVVIMHNKMRSNH